MKGTGKMAHSDYSIEYTRCNGCDRMEVDKKWVLNGRPQQAVCRWGEENAVLLRRAPQAPAQIRGLRDDGGRMPDTPRAEQEAAMKCPLNLGKYSFEGGDDCRGDCAFLVDGECAWAAIAKALKELTRKDCDDERRDA